MSDNGLHVFIFCCSEYSQLADYCVRSIDEFVEDTILSKTIISNTPVKVDGYKNLLDHDLWRTLDPDFKFKNLYNANWYRQQVFKLSLDALVSGNCLIVDAEVLFFKKHQWIKDGKQKIYTGSSKNDQRYAMFNQQLLNIATSEYSFITDTAVFSTDILQEIKATTESIHKQDYLTTITNLLFDRNDTLLSEFELYGNYITTKHSDTIVNSGCICHAIKIPNRQEYTYEELIKYLNDISEQDFISVNIENFSHTNNKDTPWLTFYYQIKDPSWPDCYTEEDFQLLPKEVQKECIEIFGYRINR